MYTKSLTKEPQATIPQSLMPRLIVGLMDTKTEKRVVRLSMSVWGVFWRW